MQRTCLCVVVVAVVAPVLLAGCLHGQPAVNETNNPSGEGDSNTTNGTGENNTDTQTNETDHEEPTAQDYRQAFNKLYPTNGTGRYAVGTEVEMGDRSYNIDTEVEFGSDSVTVNGRYYPPPGIETRIDSGLTFSNGTLTVEYDGNSTRVEGVTAADRGEVLNVEVGDREAWRYESFVPELTQILDSEKEFTDRTYSVNYRLYPDKEVVVDYFNKQFSMGIGRTPFNLSADDVDEYKVSAHLYPKYGGIGEDTLTGFRPELRISIYSEGERIGKHNMLEEKS